MTLETLETQPLPWIRIHQRDYQADPGFWFIGQSHHSWAATSMQLLSQVKLEIGRWLVETPNQKGSFSSGHPPSEIPLRPHPHMTGRINVPSDPYMTGPLLFQ